MKAWIARERDGYCGVYTEKPAYIKGEDDGEQFEYWDSERPVLFETYMPETFHPEVTFENSPMQITFTPDDGIAILERRHKMNAEKNGDKYVPMGIIYQIACESYMINHAKDMLELLKGGEG